MMSSKGHGNRSTGKVGDYFQALIVGLTQEEIGSLYGVTGDTVRKALIAANLPSTAREYLAWKFAIQFAAPKKKRKAAALGEGKP